MMPDSNTVDKLVNRFLHSEDDSVGDLKKFWELVVNEFDGNIHKAATAVIDAYRTSVSYDFFKEKGIGITDIAQAYQDDPDLQDEALEYVEEHWDSVQEQWWNLFRQTDRELPGWLLA